MAHPNGVYTVTTTVSNLGVQAPQATATTPTDVQGGGEGRTTGGGENVNYDQHRSYLLMKKAESELREQDLAVEARKLEIENKKQANQNMRDAAEANRIEMLNIKLTNQNMRQEHKLRMRVQRLKIRILEEQEENLQGQPSTSNVI